MGVYVGVDVGGCGCAVCVGGCPHISWHRDTLTDPQTNNTIQQQVQVLRTRASEAEAALAKEKEAGAAVLAELETVKEEVGKRRTQVRALGIVLGVLG